MNRVIEIVDGIVHEVPVPQDSAKAFLDAVIDGTELIQKAEMLCPDALSRFHLHRALLELATVMANAAVRVPPSEVQ